MEMEKFAQNQKKVKKFDGEIPMEELMKLQRKVMQSKQRGVGDNFSNVNWGGEDDDDDYGDSFGFTSNKAGSNKKKGGSFIGSNPQNNFDNFGFGQSDIQRFNSVPGKEGNYGRTSPFNSTNSEGHGQSKFSANQKSAIDPFEAFSFGGNTNNNNNNNTQKVNDPFAAFSFGNDNQNKSNNNANTDWITSGWDQPSNQNKSSQQNMNDPFAGFSFSSTSNNNNQQQRNNNNTNIADTFDFFGNSNTTTQQPQNQAPKQTETVDLLGLNEVKKPSIMDLYAMKI